MEKNNLKYRVVTSKTDLLVPQIDGIYLHSMYDPEKEAAGFARIHERTLKSKKNIIVLGLGFGYHIDAIAETMARHHTKFKVIVLEPNSELYADFHNKRGFKSANILAIHTKNIDSLFQREDFIEFLLTRPAIIKHDASFSLEKEFFSGLLQHQASEKIKSLVDISKHGHHFFNALDSENSIETEMNSWQSRGLTFTKQQRLLLAFNEILRENTERI